MSGTGSEGSGRSQSGHERLQSVWDWRGHAIISSKSPGSNLRIGINSARRQHVDHQSGERRDCGKTLLRRPTGPPTDSDEPPIVSDKVDADLTVALDTKGSADFYIDFADHADLAAASSITDWADRGAAVVKTLQATADASQAEVRKQLDAEQVSYTSFWIANTILVRSGSIEIAQQAVEQADVEAIRAPETYEIPEPTIGIDEQQINAVEWGIDRINADDVWSTLGVRGEGIVVGSIDTGVNFQHPALAAQYRGNSGGEIN